MGLYPVGQVVLERHDAGQSIEQIVRATGFKRATVQNLVHRFAVNLSQDLHREATVRSQTARLGELVWQAGGHR